MSATPCPLCKQPRLQRHCPETNTTCTWAVCPDCAAVVDFRGRCGVRRGLPFTWPGAQA